MKKIGNKIIADEGYVFQRIHDLVIFGNEITLGIDYSFDKKGRKDLPEYYKEIEEPIEEDIENENNILSE